MFNPKDCIMYAIWQDIKKLFWFFVVILSLVIGAVIIVIKNMS